MNYSLSSLFIQIPLAKKKNLLHTYRVPRTIVGTEDTTSEWNKALALMRGSRKINMLCVLGNSKCQEADIHKEIESERLLSVGRWLFYTGVREGFLKKWQLTRGGDWGGGKWRVPDSRNHRCKDLLYLRCIACSQKNSKVASLAGMEWVRGRCQEMRMEN